MIEQNNGVCFIMNIMNLKGKLLTVYCGIDTQLAIKRDI